MVKRVLFAVVAIPVLFVVLFFTPDWVLPIAISGLSMIAVHEVLWSTGFVKNSKISGFAIALAGLIPFWVYLEEQMFPALCVLFAYVALLFGEAMLSHATVTMEKMGGSFFLSIMIPYFLSSFIRIREFDNWAFLILLPFLTAYTSDASALFAGLRFGKHKLAPEISPKKTVEGAIGGFVGAVVGTVLYGAVLRYGFGAQVNYFLLAIYGLLGSALGQFGDLAFSYIKRQYAIKDYGTIFPGHGGVLDRFDSVIFCAPLMELLIILLPAIGG